VERAIAAWPDVAQCAVIGRTVADDEEVVAYVEPLEGRQVDVTTLSQFLRQHLAPYKVPSQINVVAQLPASSTGKVLKAVLKTWPFAGPTHS